MSEIQNIKLTVFSPSQISYIMEWQGKKDIEMVDPSSVPLTETTV
jgi:hypothetical protein